MTLNLLLLANCHSISWLKKKSSAVWNSSDSTANSKHVFHGISTGTCIIQDKHLRGKVPSRGLTAQQISKGIYLVLWVTRGPEQLNHPEFNLKKTACFWQAIYLQKDDSSVEHPICFNRGLICKLIESNFSCVALSESVVFYIPLLNFQSCQYAHSIWKNVSEVCLKHLANSLHINLCCHRYSTHWKLFRKRLDILKCKLSWPLKNGTRNRLNVYLNLLSAVKKIW